MSSAFLNSIMQKRSSFNADIQYVSEVGDIFWKVIIFCAFSEVSDNFVTPPATDVVTSLRESTFAQIVKGPLLNWCQSFFNNSPLNAEVLAITYTDLVTAAWDPTDLVAMYNLHKTKAYWKCALYTTTEPVLKLDDLIHDETVDRKLSRHIVHTSEADTLDKTSVTGIIYDLKAANANSKAFCVYHYDTDVNAVLEQLGRSFAALNSTGTVVGNKLQLLADLEIDASKNGGNNFTPIEYTDLVDQHVGFYTSVTEKDTDGVALEFGIANSAIDLFGNNVCAQWIVDYIDYRAEYQAAVLLSQDGVYLDDSTYKRILTMLDNEIKKFVTLGRLQNYQLTKKPFNKDTMVSGKTITISQAWSADYVDDAGAFTVTGDLFVTV